MTISKKIETWHKQYSRKGTFKNDDEFRMELISPSNFDDLSDDMRRVTT
jgi:hypothetical protein